MTKEKLSQFIEEGYEIKTKFQTQLAIELRDVVNEEVSKISNDRDLSPEGKKRKIEAVKQKYAKQTMQVVKEQQDKYKKLADDAIKLAKQAKTAAIAEPADKTDVQIFNNEFEQLKVSVQLATKPESALQAIEAFCSKYADRDLYYADRIKNEFSSLIGAVGDNPQHKMKLGRIYDLVVEKSINDDVRTADEALAFFSDADKVQLIRKSSPAFKAISASIGSIAQHINEPDKALGIMNGEVETFAGMHGTNVME